MSLLDKASLIVTPNGYKASKLYSVVPSSGAGDLDVTRATTATRVNSAGLIESVASNVPRIDYLNSACPSLLVEPQRTNLLTYSNQFDNAAWSKINANGGSTPIVTANYGISPDGTQNAERIQLVRTNDINSYSYIYQSFATTIGQPYTCSVWLKALSGTPSVALSLNGVYTNIATLSNQWVRYEFTGNSILNFIEATFVLYQAIPSTSLTADFLAYGFQMEQGSYPTSYIPTVASSVTRNADVISKTGISSLIGQTEGTIFLDVKAQLNSADSQDFSISDGTTNNRAFIRLASSGVIIAIGVFAGSTEFNIGSTAYTTGTRYKIALAYKNNDVVLYINGTSAATTSTTTISGTLSRLGFDVFTNGAQTIVSPVNAGILFKTRLSNAELATLTTI